MKASSARPLIFVDEITEFRRLAHPEERVAATIFRVYGFTLVFWAINTAEQIHPGIGAYLYPVGYALLTVYLAVWLAFEFPSVFRLLFFPLSAILHRGKTAPSRAEQPLHTATDDVNLCDPGQLSQVLTENTPKAEANLRRHIESAPNAAVMARAPASRVDSAVAGLAVGAFLFIIGAAPGLFLPNSLWFGFVVLFALGPAFFPVAKVLIRARQLERRRREERVQQLQPHVDKLAAEIARLADAQSPAEIETPQRFGLYLRPFLSTGRIRVNIHWLESVDVDFEMLLAYSLKAAAPVVALGQPGEHVGAGRIKTTDNDWQALAAFLIENAACVYIVPSNRPGTLWEVQFLKETRTLNKTVFIMPPEAHMTDDRTLFSTHWKETRQACAALGVLLPRHDREGMLFKLSEDGQSVSAKAAIQVALATPFIPTPIASKSEDAPLPESERSATDDAEDRDRVPAWASIMLGVPMQGGSGAVSGSDTASGGSGGYSGGDTDFGGGGD